MQPRTNVWSLSHLIPPLLPTPHSPTHTQRSNEQHRWIEAYFSKMNDSQFVGASADFDIKKGRLWACAGVMVQRFRSVLTWLDRYKCWSCWKCHVSLEAESIVGQTWCVNHEITWNYMSIMLLSLYFCYQALQGMSGKNNGRSINNCTYEMWTFLIYSLPECIGCL